MDGSEFKPINELISHFWNKYGNGDNRGFMGLTIEEVVIGAQQTNDAESIDVLNSWLKLFDEFVSYFINLWYVLTGTGPDNLPKTEQHRACWVLVAAICADLLSVRKLVTEGYDIHAKVLVRLLTERVAILCLVMKDKNIATEFMEADGFESSNAFWFKYLAKGKRKKFLNQSVKEIFGDGALWSYFEKWRDEEDKVLAAAAHPSLLSCQLSIIPNKKDESYRPPFFGRKTDVSVRTLKYSIMSFMEFFLAHKGFPFETSNSDMSIVFNANDEYHRHIKNNSEVVFVLLYFVLRFGHEHPELILSDDPPFVLAEDDE